MAVQHNSLSESRLQLVPKSVTQSSYRIHPEPICRQLAGGAKRNIKQNVLGSGAATRFMTGSMDQRFQANPLTNIKNAYAFRAIHFVPCDREQIDAKFLDISWNLARGLRCIGVEQHPPLARHPANLGDGLQTANLIVGMHHRYEKGALCNGPCNIFGIDATVAINRNVRHRGPEPLKKPAWVEDGRVLNGRGDDGSIPLLSEVSPLQRVVVGFAAAAGESAFLRS